MNTAPEASAIELLKTMEGKGFSLTLEARGTAQKWVTGKNLFMGMTGPDGTTVRNHHSPVTMEMPLRVGRQLNWTNEDGTQLENLTQALRNTIQRGLVRRGSHLYCAISVLAHCAK